jgi:hypothetical protein
VIVPLESVVTMLLWIGIVMSASSFQSTPDPAAAAVVVGILPGIAAWTCTELTQVISVTKSTLEDVRDARPDLYLNGLFALRMGYILVSLLLSSMYHHIEERRFSVAALWALFGAVLSATGMIHTFTLDGNDLSPSMGFLVDARSQAFTAAYVLCAVLLGVTGIGHPEEGTWWAMLRSIGKGVRPDQMQPYAPPSFSRRSSNKGVGAPRLQTIKGMSSPLRSPEMRPQRPVPSDRPDAATPVLFEELQQPLLGTGP